MADLKEAENDLAFLSARIGAWRATVGEITVSVVGSKNPNWFDTHQILKNAAYAIPDEAATRLMTASLDVTDLCRDESRLTLSITLVESMSSSATRATVSSLRLRKCRLNKSTSNSQPTYTA